MSNFWGVYHTCNAGLEYNKKRLTERRITFVRKGFHITLRINTKEFFVSTEKGRIITKAAVDINIACCYTFPKELTRSMEALNIDIFADRHIGGPFNNAIKLRLA